MIWQGIDNRRFPRADYPCKVVVLRSDLKKTFTTHTENIGVGGICVFLPEELPKFCHVQIVVFLKDEKTPIDCSGMIVWSIQRKNNVDTGIEFIDIKQIDRLKIERIVQEYLDREA